MSTTEKKLQLTDEELQQYEEKSAEIAKQLGVEKVHPVVFINPETAERAVCYLKEPDFQTKLAIMDKALILGVYQAGHELSQLCVIKEHSDAITYADIYAAEDFKMGVVDYCLTMIKRYQNQFKKK